MNAALHKPRVPFDAHAWTAQRQAVRAAFVALVDALGVTAEADCHTANRAADLWLDHLLAGRKMNAATALGQGTELNSRTPVVLEGLGFHMVCPHHLTVAAGTAAVAYIPGGRVVGFGQVADLVHACTGRLVLQEQATAHIAQTLISQLQAQAVVVRLQGQHPCHTVLHPRSHQANATTWALQGDPNGIAALQQLMGAQPAPFSAGVPGSGSALNSVLVPGAGSAPVPDLKF